MSLNMKPLDASGTHIPRCANNLDCTCHRILTMTGAQTKLDHKQASIDTRRICTPKAAHKQTMTRDMLMVGTRMRKIGKSKVIDMHCADTLKMRTRCALHTVPLSTIGSLSSPFSLSSVLSRDPQTRARPRAAPAGPPWPPEFLWAPSSPHKSSPHTWGNTLELEAQLLETGRTRSQSRDCRECSEIDRHSTWGRCCHRESSPFLWLRFSFDSKF